MKRFILMLVLLGAPAFGVQPDEMLADPALEARARDISQGLRCLVCRNENIDESNAGLARDLRLLLRERLLAGDSDEEAVAFIVSRYGEYVLLQPTTEGANLLLWIAGPLMLLLALGSAGFYLRARRSAQEPPAPELTAEERLTLREILDREA